MRMPAGGHGAQDPWPCPTKTSTIGRRERLRSMPCGDDAAPSRRSPAGVHLPVTRLSSGLLVLLLFALHGTGAERLASTDFCDPGLEVSRIHPLGYRNRPGRCEGIYLRQLGSDTLHLASLTARFDDYDPVGMDALQVAWAPLVDDPVHLRAEALRHRLYYRMDTVRSPGTDAYAWPTDILAALNLRRAELGVLAWARRTVEGAERRLYLPLRVGGSAGGPASGEVDLVLVPGRELRELYVRLSYVGAAGDPGVPIRDGEPLAYGYYPAGRALRVPLTGLSRIGDYRVELGAELQDGSIATIRFWLRSAGG